MFACLIFISSIIKLSTTHIQKNTFGFSHLENSINSLKIFSLFFSLNFLESVIFSRNFLFGRLFGAKDKAQATTLQSQGHLPASSIQILYFKAFFIFSKYTSFRSFCSNSKLKF
ncbi:MAG: hypothetical protein LBD88_02360 [Candidatus Peribacteria bacterium]|nr:hypothetical protein [Candidatus Peribacteria bacterium]